ncbi:hypothetical protein [Streptomyces mirabilis]|uniref:Transposase n=1 Tax=Streptomyces mirabilis TaxID=68239 RepID=A0ABU3V645_9ACTN|nr:hypothetical protein [Streptomyces mirabilis]MDU9001639.1 hypothetical protein [Streptomyces mirabilis]
MDSQVAAALRVFATLTQTQRDEFVTVVNNYINGDRPTQDRIVHESTRNWAITKVDLGPTSQVCPACGR